MVVIMRSHWITLIYAFLKYKYANGFVMWNPIFYKCILISVFLHTAENLKLISEERNLHSTDNFRSVTGCIKFSPPAFVSVRLIILVNLQTVLYYTC